MKHLIFLLFISINSSKISAQLFNVKINNQSTKNIGVFRIDYNKDTIKHNSYVLLCPSCSYGPSPYSITDIIRTDIIAVDISTGDTVYAKPFYSSELTGQLINIENGRIERLPPLSPVPRLKVKSKKTSWYFKPNDNINIKTNSRNIIKGKIVSYNKNYITIKTNEGNSQQITKPDIEYIKIRSHSCIFLWGAKGHIGCMYKQIKIRNPIFRLETQKWKRKKVDDGSFEWIEVEN